MQQYVIFKRTSFSYVLLLWWRGYAGLARYGKGGGGKGRRNCPAGFPMDIWKRLQAAAGIFAGRKWFLA